MPTTSVRFPSPVGELILTATETALTGVYFPTSRHVPPRHEVEPPRAAERRGAGGEVLARTSDQLSEYFAGTRTSFDLPLDPRGTAFELRVWEELRAIPYGVTRSYSDIARRLGDLRSTRAVGAANGKNPIPIIVPCHRVIGAHGDLTGFGGGIDRKRWLLEHERALLPLKG